MYRKKNTTTFTEHWFARFTTLLELQEINSFKNKNKILKYVMWDTLNHKYVIVLKEGANVLPSRDLYLLEGRCWEREVEQCRKKRWRKLVIVIEVMK